MSQSKRKPKLKVNYRAVHQLHPSEVPERADERRALDIVAFHGMQLTDGRKAWMETWTNKDGVCWLKDWLPEELHETCRGNFSRVLSISYNAQATGHWTGVFGRRSQGHQDISEELSSELLSNQRWLLGSKPFVLVGHSYGGIVIKSLLAHIYKLSLKNDFSNPVVARTSELANKAMANLRGIVFYGVPQRGSELASFIYHSNKILPIMWLGKIFKDLTFNQEIERLTENFEDAISRCQALSVEKRGVAQFAFAESKRTHHVMVVKPASARGNLDPAAFRVVTGTDHYTVCKPNSKDDPAFHHFVTFLNDDVIKNDPELRKHMPRASLLAPGLPSERTHRRTEKIRRMLRKAFRKTQRKL